MKKLYVPSPEQKESARHGETLFPMQKYITKLDLAYPVVTTHWHEEAELTLITEGEGLYQIDLVDYEVKKGDILFVPPLLLHSVSVAQPQNEEMISETYVFHLNFLGGNSTDICSTRYFVPIMNHELILPCLITPKQPGYELALKGLFLQVVFLLLQYSTKQAKNVLPEEGTPADKLKNVLDYIEIHYAQTISVEELAKICCFSEYHFMRFFKKHMNMTCVEYVNNVRLEKAVELFEQGNTSILEVSLSVGFHNLSYFHRAFKNKYGMTPRSFIKELK